MGHCTSRVPQLEDIEQMVKDTEKYVEEDKAHQDRMGSKNSLEGYCYSMKSSIEGDLKEKLGEDDRKTIEDKVNETISWLETNSNAEMNEFDDKRKDLEDVCGPIMNSMNTNGDGAVPVAPDNGPTVEEVD